MKKQELIAQYFTKSLSIEAKKEFDHLMETDPEFVKEVTFQKNLKIVIGKEEEDAVKSQLQDFEAEDNTTFNYKKWLVAASVVILFGLYGLWYFNNTIDTEKLYAEHFEPYRNVVQPIVRGNTKMNLKTKAFTAYETKNYKEAINVFNQLLDEKSDETIAFYKANSLLALNKTESAVLIFDQNLKTTDSLDDKNKWYLALAYLKLNNIESAKAILNELNASSSFKNKDVKTLLKKLD